MPVRVMGRRSQRRQQFRPRSRVLCLACGALVFLSVVRPGLAEGIETADPVRLAADLFAEGDWHGCRTECLRVLLSDPDHHTARILKAQSDATLRQAPVPPRPAPLDRLPLAALALYRTQIGPAIGSRCSLLPSCSEYARQAVLRHGWIGLALIGDRAVREPDVVRAARGPVRVNGRRRYPDPLDAHDGWLGRREREEDGTQP